MAKITTRHSGDLRFETELGDHVLVTDVRNNKGPKPPEIFVASLSTCVGVLVADYCERVGIDADGLAVDVDYQWASDPSRLSDIKVTIDLPNAELNGRARAIKRVAEHCPVHQTICTLDGAAIEVNGKGG
ncbi:MAG: OsmC family protein [Anaerolineae bacterium]